MSAALLARIQNLIAQGKNKMSWEYGVEESLFYHYFKVLSLESNSIGQGFYHFCSFPYPQNLSTMPGTWQTLDITGSIIVIILLFITISITIIVV